MDWMQYANEDKDWGFNFAPELFDGDEITEVLNVVDGGLTIDRVAHTEQQVTFFVSGGESNRYYALAATVRSAAGRTLTMTAVMYIR